MYNPVCGAPGPAARFHLFEERAMNRILTGIAAAAALLPAVALGQGLDGLDLGTHVYGEKWSLDELRGRTVAVFFWDLT